MDKVQKLEGPLLREVEGLPALGKGTYILILQLKRNWRIKIGRRKGSSPILFRAGYYAYVGSALGPGGLRSRIKRHLRTDKKCVWHIDYLRKVAEPVEAWICSGERKMEREWADALIQMEGSQPVEGFGNTDDKRSRTHLCYCEERPMIEDYRHDYIRKIDLTLITQKMTNYPNYLKKYSLTSSSSKLIL
jgi:Uri superfamily endonuclease